MNNIIQNWKSSTLTGLRKFDNEIGIWLQVVVCWTLYGSMILFSNLVNLFIERLDKGNNFENKRSSESTNNDNHNNNTRRLALLVIDNEILESLHC